MRPSWTSAVLAAAALVVATGCGARKDPVLALVGDLQAAAEDKSADGIRDRLSERFRGQGGIDRSEAYAQLRRYFGAYERIDLEVFDVSVQRGEGSADVTFRVDFSGHVRSIGGLEGLFPPGAAYRFDLHLVEQAGVWKVERAQWEEATPPAAEG